MFSILALQPFSGFADIRSDEIPFNRSREPSMSSYRLCLSGEWCNNCTTVEWHFDETEKLPIEYSAYEQEIIIMILLLVHGETESKKRHRLNCFFHLQLYRKSTAIAFSMHFFSYRGIRSSVENVCITLQRAERLWQTARLEITKKQNKKICSEYSNAACCYSECEVEVVRESLYVFEYI